MGEEGLAATANAKESGSRAGPRTPPLPRAAPPTPRTPLTPRPLMTRLEWPVLSFEHIEHIAHD